MGRKRKNAEEKRKPVKVRLIERKHAGKVVEPYRLMEELVAEHHKELAPAKILIAWRTGWKPDVDKVLILAKCRKATDTDKYVFGCESDFVIELNSESWPGLSDAKKLQVMDHELYHAAPDQDRDGKQKIDMRERFVWRCRKHPIQEFPEIIERYGIDEVLNLKQQAVEAAERAKTPLLNSIEKPEANPDGQPVNPDGWKRMSLAAAAFKENHQDALEGAGLRLLGDLQEKMNQHGQFWAKECGINGRFKTPIEDAFNAYLTDVCKPTK